MEKLKYVKKKCSCGALNQGLVGLEEGTIPPQY
jgi:hypothetical protein